jgi:alkane 1-monooxygenase
MRDLKYLLAYLIPLSAWMGIEYRGFWVWSAFILTFGIVPVLDAVLPASTRNVPAEEEEKRSALVFFDLLLYACAPISFFLLFLYFQTINTEDLSLSETLGLTVGMGIVLGSMGINVAHELGHRSSKTARLFAWAGLMPVLYQHFFIEHNRGHHKNVSTDKDPATARKDENLYTFFLRSITGQYKSAWRLENNRLKSNDQAAMSWHNEMVRFTVYQLLYLAVVGIIFGIEMLPYSFAVALIGVLLLEAVNYIEHYGLKRDLLPTGKPERVLPKHSWNSDFEMGRIMLFELTRHSDHHYKASRKYQVLRHMEEAPQLPVGYPAGMLMATVPPLWFKVMNKRLLQIKKK